MTDVVFKYMYIFETKKNIDDLGSIPVFYFHYVHNLSFSRTINAVVNIVNASRLIVKYNFIYP